MKLFLILVGVCIAALFSAIAMTPNEHNSANRAHLAALPLVRDEGLRKLLIPGLNVKGAEVQRPDNLRIPKPRPHRSAGADPFLGRQWGLKDIGAAQAWNKSRGKDVVVALIDSGVDYTHEDLVQNLWRNPGESGTDARGRDKSNNGIDDDGNGFVDDIIGWDFLSNDNTPYDLSSGLLGVILAGGNAGHGTHCAGTIAGAGRNRRGISGIAPEAKIMALRFLGMRGEGSPENAIKAVRYAIKMGAKIISSSWIIEGEDPKNPKLNQDMRDVMLEAEKAGVLFIAAAGNGRAQIGYDNDNDPNPIYPASYGNDNIISVAAIDRDDTLAAFSNWGKFSVDLGAPGVDIFSTMVGNSYGNVMARYLSGKLYWDGTSMAVPHVTGAAALYWSMHPEATALQVKDAILNAVKPIPSLNGKTVTGGKLNLENLVNQ